ncbi:MAG: hypothetical protein IKF52_02225 [Clostridia bacterium]|nr:hypothetical protein [Clostridia bacterium]
MKNKLINITIFLIIIDIFFYVPLIQLEFAVFNKVIITNLMIKIIILLFIVVIGIGNKKIIIKEKLEKKIYLILLELFLILPILSFCNNSNFIIDFFNILGQNYFYFIFAYFFIVNRDKIDFDKIIKIVFFIGVLNAIICFFQYKNDSILYPYLYYSDGTTIFNSIIFYSGTHTSRSVGMCTSGYECGIVLSFSIVYCMFQIFNKEKKIKAPWVLAIVVLGFAIYTTKTRNIYLLILYILLFLLIYRIIFLKKIRNIIAKKMPIFLVIIFILIFMLHSSAIASYKGKELFSLYTLMVRFDEWRGALKDFSNYPINTFFGFAKSQVNGIITDNVYIDTTYTLGIVGLFIIVNYYITLSTGLYRYIEKNKYILFQYAFTSSIFIIGSVNLISLPFGLLAVAIPSALYLKEVDKTKESVL